MLTTQHIVTHLVIQLFQLYGCKALHHISEAKRLLFRDHLMWSISTLCHIRYELLPTDETFYRATRRCMCSSAMKEKLAMFFYAAIATTEEERNRIMADYLRIANCQRLRHTPYWQRYIDEHYKQGKLKPPPFVLPRLLYRSIKALSNKEFERLDKVVKRVGRERRKRV